MLLHLGSTGADIGRLEVRLRELCLYSGPVDNVYGGGVESAVKAFQKLRGLVPDGVVGDRAERALFPGTEMAGSAPVNPLVNAPLVQRCLALTGTFETSSGIPDCYAGLSGDFDGQGLSLGVAQWNIG
jgi:peptidoglycan hydrolase-like protein with peptidoglycan-binding domain